MTRVQQLWLRDLSIVTAPVLSVVTRGEFDAFMSRAVPLSIAIGAFSLVITVAEALTSSLFEVRGCLDKFGVFSTTLIYSAAAICMFGISLVS